MNFISTPARNVFNSENAQSVIQRKVGSSALQARNPFQDRAVNCNTPSSVFKKPKFDIPNKQIVKSLFRPAAEDLENLEQDFCYKDYDEQFEELYSTPLNEKHVFDMISSYVNIDTPPPSPQMFPELIDLSLDEISYENVCEHNDDYEAFFKTPEFKGSMTDDAISFPTPPEFQELIFE